MLTAGDLLREQASTLAGRNRTAYDRLMQQLAALQKAWPSVVPPRQPVLGAAPVQAAVSRIQLEASQLK